MISRQEVTSGHTHKNKKKLSHFKVRIRSVQMVREYRIFVIFETWFKFITLHAIRRADPSWMPSNICVIKSLKQNMKAGSLLLTYLLTGLVLFERRVVLKGGHFNCGRTIAFNGEGYTVGQLSGAKVRCILNNWGTFRLFKGVQVTSW